MRLTRGRAGRFLLCSGYLFAFRRRLIDRVPADALSEDAVISHRIAQQGYSIAYAPEAQVYVKYPTTYSDWLRQKTRSAGGYAQTYVRRSPVRMRSAWLEIKTGTLMALQYPRSAREFVWTLMLFAAGACQGTYAPTPTSYALGARRVNQVTVSPGSTGKGTPD
jgi:cellulose synthase/poly-beta-1,6-N-acetylglucosamine synthase-like glycosyltransferase